MNVLIVCSGNTNSVFVDDQVNSLRDLGVNISYYRIKGKGLFGYLRAIPSYLRTISNFKPDLIHAHFGLSGLFANLQFNFPVITTYHGCDINRLPLLILSLPPLILSKFNIFVSQKQLDKVSYLMSFFKKKHSVLPCGVDTSFFTPIDKNEARKKLGLKQNMKYILFSGAFDNPVKNIKLAFDSIALLNMDNIELLELKGLTREQVLLFMNASDLGLLTSFREGSPMFIKELMSLNKPIVSTDVGDVSERIKQYEGSYIVPFDSLVISRKINEALKYDSVRSREFIVNEDLNLIAKKILEIYNKLV